MQGGINNAGLFGASQREARSKLDQMAGIKRPNGILASSPELMRSVAGPTMGQPQPIMPMAQPMPMAQAPMMPPAMPMPTTVAPAPRSLNPMAPAPAAASAQPVVKLAEGGEPFRPRFQGDVPATAKMTPTGVDITQTATEFVQDMDKKTNGAVIEKYGSIEEAAKEGTRRASIIESATEATKDPSKIADAVLVASGEQPTEAAKIDFAENVFGLKDVDDIDEINRRIANVAIGGSVAKSPEEFTQAVILGLNALKGTAAARAAAAAGGKSSGFEPLPRYAEALPDMVKTIMTNNPGITAQEAAQQAALVLDPLYNKAAGGSAGTGGSAAGGEKRITMYDPSGKPFYSTDGTNFVDADGNPYVPPTQE